MTQGGVYNDDDDGVSSSYNPGGLGGEMGISGGAVPVVMCFLSFFFYNSTTQLQPGIRE